MVLQEAYCVHIVGTIIVLLIISIVGLISLSWFRGNYLISADDFSMPFDRIKSFVANFYSWDPQSLGSANPRILAFTFPVYTYFAISEVIGLSLVNAEKILFYGIFTIERFINVLPNYNFVEQEEFYIQKLGWFNFRSFLYAESLCCTQHSAIATSKLCNLCFFTIVFGAFRKVFK